MIRDALTKIADEYNGAKQEEFSGHPLADYMRKDAVNVFRNALGLASTNIIVKGSAGQSNWSDVPWIAFLDSLITDTNLRGYYIVYLFAADGRDVYLCMGQGVTAVKEEFGRDWKKILYQRSALIRARVPEYQNRFQDKTIDLKGASGRAKSYPEALAFYKRYSVSNMPSENELLSDLSFILELYSKLIFLGGTDLIEGNDNDKEVTQDLSLIEKKRFRLHQKVEGRVNTDKVKKHLGYTCQACDFNFQDTYGDLGDKFIEAHHLIPYAELGEGKLRKLNIEKDFAVLCANCHRMIHRMEDPSDIKTLRNLILNKRR